MSDNLNQLNILVQDRRPTANPVEYDKIKYLTAEQLINLVNNNSNCPIGVEISEVGPTGAALVMEEITCGETLRIWSETDNFLNLTSTEDGLQLGLDLNSGVCSLFAALPTCDEYILPGTGGSITLINTNAFGESWETGGDWSSGQPASALPGDDYLVESGLDLRSEDNAALSIFPGQSLTFMDGQFILKPAVSGTIVVNDLRFDQGTINVGYSGNNRSATLEGQLSIAAGGLIFFYGGLERVLNLDSLIIGNGPIIINGDVGNNGSLFINNSNNTYCGDITLNEGNLAFTYDVISPISLTIESNGTFDLYGRTHIFGDLVNNGSITDSIGGGSYTIGLTVGNEVDPDEDLILLKDASDSSLYTQTINQLLSNCSIPISIGESGPTGYSVSCGETLEVWSKTDDLLNLTSDETGVQIELDFRGPNNVGIGNDALTSLTTGVDNVAIGNNALRDHMEMDRNIAIGANALQQSTTQRDNIAIGANAISGANTVNNLVAIGNFALTANTSGVYNVAVGRSALRGNETGARNMGLGYYALRNNVSGSRNTGVGAFAGRSILGNDNFALGYLAMGNNVANTGTRNFALGNYALRAVTTGNDNVAIGHRVLDAITDGSQNIGIGTDSLTVNTSGNQNVSIGWKSLQSSTSSNLTSIGSYALYYNTTGTRNTALGYRALYSNTIGSYNTAIGNHALENSTTGFQGINTAVGDYALNNNTTGTRNMGIGAFALEYNTTGSRNVAVGYSSLLCDNAGNTGDDNIGIGWISLRYNSSGSNNIAIGRSSLYNNSTGDYNVAVGRDALFSTMTANNNTAIGRNAGNLITTGSNNIFVGSNTDGDTNARDGCTVIGSGGIADADDQFAVAVGTTTKFRTTFSEISSGGKDCWEIELNGVARTITLDNCGGTGTFENVEISSDLSVTGDATICGDLAIKGLTACSELDILNDQILVKPFGSEVLCGTTSNDLICRIYNDNSAYGETAEIISELACAQPTLTNNRIFVGPTGVGSQDGSDWDNVRNLPDAISAANSGDELWLQQGLYDVSIDTTYTMNKNLKLYGGFIGTSGTDDTRSTDRTLTVLDGMESTRIMDFSTNEISITLDTMTLRNGLVNVGSQAALDGAAIKINRSLVTLMMNNILFENNRAGRNGGAISVDFNRQPTIILCDCKFIDNDSNIGGTVFGSRGGGAICCADSPVEEFHAFNCDFESNTNGAFNGANGGFAILLNEVLNGATLTNCRFYNNTGQVSGAVNIGVTNSPLILTNCTFYGNLSLNDATLRSGALYARGPTGTFVRNCIFSGNSAGNRPEIVADNTVMTFSNTLVKDGNVAGIIDTTNGGSYTPLSLPLTDDPLFIDEGTGDLGLQDISPAVNSGDDTWMTIALSNPAFVGGLSSVDLNGHPRFFNTIDLGAFERQRGIFLDFSISDKILVKSATDEFYTITPEDFACRLVEDATGCHAAFKSLEVINDAHIYGKLTVDGLIDPTGLVLEEQLERPYEPIGTTQGLIWVKSDMIGGTGEANVLKYTDNEGVDWCLQPKAAICDYELESDLCQEPDSGTGQIWYVTDATGSVLTEPAEDGLFEINAFQVSAGGTDASLDSITETSNIWDAIYGGATVPGIISAGGNTYNISAYENGTETLVDYRDGGNFGINNQYTSIGGGTITQLDQLSVRARAYLTFTVAGDYSISIASDDGRRLNIPGKTLINEGGTFNGGGIGFDYIEFNALTGHNQTIAVINVTAGETVFIDGFFFERTGGQSLEIAIAQGNITSFGGSFQLLQDGVFGITLSSTLVASTETSWTQPTTLENALTSANSGDEIWLKKGIYNGTFTLDKEVLIFGGFNGYETKRSQRNKNPVTNGTILSGGDIVLDVVTGATSSRTRLDGVTVRDGISTDEGGGIRISDAGMALVNVHIRNNTSDSNGAGLAVINSNLIMCNCVVEDNTLSTTVGFQRGGGIGVRTSGTNTVSIIILNTQINNNTVTTTGINPAGGGISFLHNSSGNTFTAIVLGCTITNNSVIGSGSTEGGGVYINNVDGDMDTRLINCTITNNSTDNSIGGGVLSRGGGFFIDNTTVDLLNSIVWNNNVTGVGTSGEQIHTGNGSANIRDCLIENSTVEISGSLSDISIKGATGLSTSDIQSDDPEFVNPLSDFKLKSTSPAINQGYNTHLSGLSFSIPTDLAGNIRIQGGSVDIGAYEYVPSGTKILTKQGDNLVTQSFFNLIENTSFNSIKVLGNADIGGDTEIGGDIVILGDTEICGELSIKGLGSCSEIDAENDSILLQQSGSDTLCTTTPLQLVCDVFPNSDVSVTYSFDGNSASPTSNEFDITANDVGITGSAALSITQERVERYFNDSGSAIFSFSLDIPSDITVNFSELSFTNGIDLGNGNPSLIIYEGFQYGMTGPGDIGDQLEGQPDSLGPTGDIDAIGLTGVWMEDVIFNDGMFIKEGSLEFGDLQTSGNHIGFNSNSDSDIFSRELTLEAQSSVSSANEIWFSFLADKAQNNFNAAEGGVVLANKTVGDPRILLNDGTDGLAGVGIAPTTNGDDWTAYAWDGSTIYTGDASRVVGLGIGEVHMLIGHVSFGTGTGGLDVFTVYEYLLNGGSIVGGTLSQIASPIEANVSQSTLNTLNITRQVNTNYDEFKLGTCLADLLDGVTPATFSRWDLTVSVGSASQTYGTLSSVAGATGIFQDSNTLVLSDMDNLTNTTVTFDFSVNYGETGDFGGNGNCDRYTAFLDDIVITGKQTDNQTRLLTKQAGNLSAQTFCELLSNAGDCDACVQNLEVKGKLTVDGLIDPTGLVLEGQTGAPYGPEGTSQGLIWIEDDTPTKLMYTDNQNKDSNVIIGVDDSENSVLGAGNLSLEKLAYYKQIAASAICPESETQLTNILRVTQDGPLGAGDGSSWDDAMDLETAISTASTDTEIWLKKNYGATGAGAYLLTARRQLGSIKSLYGGFEGTETLRSERPKPVEPSDTLISGGFANNGLQFNSGTVVIDGIQLQDCATALVFGFGVTNSNVTVRSCIFTENDRQIAGGNGAAVFQHNTNSDTEITFCDCLISNNISITAGAIDIDGINTANCYNVRFKNNTNAVQTQSRGAALNINGGPATCVNCIFNNNGGDFTASGGAVNLSNFTITPPQTSVFINCSFANNVENSSAFITGGGAILLDLVGMADCYNCIFYNNTSNNQGDNVSVRRGGSVFNFINGILDPGASSLFVDIGNGASGTFINNLGDVDPLFTDSDLRIDFESSPALDAGDPSLFPSVPGESIDLDGYARIRNGLINLGAFATPTENPSSNTAFGHKSGQNLIEGENNSFFGTNAGSSIELSSNNTLIGANTNGATGTSGSTVLGSGGLANENDQFALAVGTTTKFRTSFGETAINGQDYWEVELNGVNRNIPLDTQGSSVTSATGPIVFSDEGTTPSNTGGLTPDTWLKTVVNGVTYHLPLFI